MMRSGGRWWRLTRGGGLAFALVVGLGQLEAQETSEPSGPPQQTQPPAQVDADASSVVSPENLGKIRDAIDAESRPVLDLDLTFFLRVVEEAPTFADYLAKAPPGWAEITPILPPSPGIGRGPSPASLAVASAGGGIDLLDIFRSIGRARRERETQRIRRQIDRELAAFDRPGTSQPPPDTDDSTEGAPPNDE